MSDWAAYGGDSAAGAESACADCGGAAGGEEVGFGAGGELAEQKDSKRKIASVPTKSKT